MAGVDAASSDNAQRQGVRELRRVAAIDIGTNSTHLLVAAVDPSLRTFSVVLAEKFTTRLGERDAATGHLSKEALARGMDALRRFTDLAASHQVEQIVTAATSAVREAPNGRQFLQQVKDELDLDVDEQVALHHRVALDGEAWTSHGINK